MAADKHTATERFIALILLCYPVLFLTLKGGMNGMFFLLLLVSAFTLSSRKGFLSGMVEDRCCLAYTLAMASPILAVFISQASHGSFAVSAYDGPSRFLLAVPVFLVLRQIDIRSLSLLQYGFPLGALAALGYVFISPRNWQDDSLLLPSQFSNHIHFGDSALILGFLSLFSINWSRPDPVPVLTLKLGGFLAGLYVSGLSGARGGWLAIPVLLLVWFWSQTSIRPAFRIVAALAVILAIVPLGYVLIDSFHDRLGMISQDISDYRHGNPDTSIGIRLQLWLAAWQLFTQHPLFGIGPGNFAGMMSPLSDNGMLTARAAEFGHSEVHNEILAKSVEMGIFGLISILSVFLAPAFIFIRSFRTTSTPKRVAALTGICLVLGFFIFGLSVEIFNLKMTAAFYSLTIAVLLAAATHKTSIH